MSDAGHTGEYLHLANEFAEVLVRRVNTRNGVRLEIVAPKLERRILLDPDRADAGDGLELPAHAVRPGARGRVAPWAGSTGRWG
jgi:hypothetical protein